MKRYLIWAALPLIIIAVVLVIIWVYPNPLKNLINKRFPPISYKTVQNSYLQKNQQALNYIGHPDVVINLSQKDIHFLVDSAVKQISNNPKIYIPHISKYKIKDVNASCNNELVNISADFNITLDTLNIKLAGKFSGVVAFTIRNDSLLLAPAFKTVHLDTADYKKVKGLDAKILAVFVTQLLKDFMDNLNGYVDAKLKGFDLDMVDRKLLDTGILKNNHAHISATKPLQISLPDLTGACLVDTGGIHVLGAFHHGSQTPASYSPPDPVAFEKDFLIFHNAFFSQQSLVFPGAPTNRTFFLVTKSSVATILNGLLANNTIAGVYRDTLKVKPYDKEEIIYSSDIDCSKINVNCPTVPIRPYNHCSGNPIKRGKCELGNLGILHLNVAAAILNTHIVAACKTTEVATSATCASVKEVINKTGGQVKLAKVHFDANAVGHLNAGISDFHITDDLSEVRLNIQLKADMTAVANYSIRTENEGKLICPFNIGSPIQDSVTGQLGSTSQIAKISITIGDGDKILLGLVISPIPFGVRMSKAPAVLVLNTLNSALNCTIPGVDKITNFSNIMTSKFAEKFGDLLARDDAEQAVRLILTGQADITTPQLPVDFSLNPKPVELFNKSIDLKPIIDNTYLGFSD
jgi:hypothetical protein